MKYLIPFLLLLPTLVLPRSAGQSKDKPKENPPTALYALSLAADPGKSTKLTVRGVGLDTATEVRLGEPKSSGKVLGKGRKIAVPNQMLPQIVGDSEIDVGRPPRGRESEQERTEDRHACREA